MTVTLLDTHNLFRLIVFRWSDQSGPSAVPGVSQILADTGYTFTSPINVDNLNANRIHIIHDQLYTVSYSNVAQKFVKRIVYGKKLGRKKLHYFNNGLSATNHIYFMIVSDSGSETHPSYNMTFYTHFTDC